MAFIYSQKVLFRHCDPAAIVFYPRYFEMMNDVVEEFFDTVLGFSFNQMHKKNGIPTVQMETKFVAPSRLGDVLKIELDCVKIGHTSLSFNYKAVCETQLRFTAHSTVVFVDSNGKPTPWPDGLRQKLENQIEGNFGVK
ncbi:MAG: thioesterase family protein [Rhizobiaceae bacterium]